MARDVTKRRQKQTAVKVNKSASNPSTAVTVNPALTVAANQAPPVAANSTPKVAVNPASTVAANPSALVVTTPVAPNTAPLKPNEIIDKKVLKTAIEASIKKYILAYVPNGAIVSNTGQDRNGMRDGTERTDLIDVNSWLEWEHVYGAIPILVAERPHLRESVGVFPPYNLERMKQFLESQVTRKLIEDEGVPTRITPNGDIVINEPELPSLIGLTLRERDLVNNEQQRRNAVERARYAKAKELLTKNNLSEEKAFVLYLEALGESEENFIGNPYKKDLALGDCSQLIIPFNFNNTHFAVSVVHFVQEGDQKIAEIKHYDSMGSDLREILKQQLIEYCRGLGFEPRYSCISRPDQRFDGYNCGMFASFKAIDIVNENAKNSERLLGNLRADNYHQVMNSYRYIISLKLREFGVNVASSEILTMRLKQQQESFERASVYTQQVGMLNALLLEVKNQLDMGLRVAKGLPETQNNALPTTPLPDLQPRNIYNECSSLYNEAINLLQTLEQKQNKTDEDNLRHNALRGRVDMFRTIGADLLGQIIALERRNRTILSRVGLSSLNAWITGQNWRRLAWMVPLACLCILFAVPLVGSLLLSLGAFLGENLTVSLLVGTGVLVVFGAGGLISYTLSNLLTGEEENAATQRQQVTNEEVIPELVNMTTAASPIASTVAGRPGNIERTLIEKQLEESRLQLEATMKAIPTPALLSSASAIDTVQPLLVPQAQQSKAIPTVEANAGSSLTGPGSPEEEAVVSPRRSARIKAQRRKSV